VSADVVIALPKGRLQKPALELLTRGGVEGLALDQFVAGTWANCRLGLMELGVLLIRDDDVPTYVAKGAADLGMVGKDVLDETEEQVVELLDLEIGNCRLSLAVPGSRYMVFNNGNIRRVATKYPRTAELFFRQLGWQVQIIKLHGAVEIAPTLGLSDAVVDLVSTGRTLKDSGLIEKKVLKKCSTRLIGNRASYRVKSSCLKPIIEALRLQLKLHAKEGAYENANS
jgi:ATP phosphoribosyltransferase